MKVIESSQLGDGPTTLGAEAEQLEIYDRLVSPISNDVIVLSDQHRRQIAHFARYALFNYQPEPTLAMQVHGVASLVTRVDCTIQNGTMKPYELEDSPSGLGVTHRLHQRAGGVGLQCRILGHYDAVAGETPFVIVSGSRPHGTDDPVIYGVENYHHQAGDFSTPERLVDERPVIVKTVPGMPESQQPYAHLVQRALAPLFTEGDKSYGDLERLRLAMARVRRPGDLLCDVEGELVSQVLKAKVGSMALGVSVFLASADKKEFGKKGTVTTTRLLADVERFVARDGHAYTQQFRPPIQIENPEGRRNMILRVFVLSHPATAERSMQTEVIGGVYVARPELLVHGASNSVAGAVLVQ